MKRLASLDTLRGCTPTDLVFPFFLFVIGMSLAFAAAFVALWWLIVRAMDRRRIHLKL